MFHTIEGTSSMAEESKIIIRACLALENGLIEQAEKIMENEYPHEIRELSKRRYSEFQSTQIFIRDGFIDRYSGQRLVFPPVLRVLSQLIPNVFPFQKNWKMKDCHIAYWQLSPTIDHIIPIARGGEDNQTNWVCTSMLRNSSKSNWMLHELGWKLYPAGDFKKWDGLLHWFLKFVGKDKGILSEPTTVPLNYRINSIG